MPVTVTPDNVRRAISLSLSAENVPDAAIESAIYEGRALAEIKARFPDADSAVGEDLAHLNRAADFLTAALLVPAIPNLTRVQHGSALAYQMEAWSVEGKVAELRSLAEEELSQVEDVAEVTVEVTESMPVVFGLASGRRGL